MAQISNSTVHDVVIIGSGAGGGTVTKVLADLGVRVLLMEAGPDGHDGRLQDLASPLDDWHRGAGDAAELYTTGQGAPFQQPSVVFPPSLTDEPYTVAPGSQFRWCRSRVHRRPHEPLLARAAALLRLRLQEPVDEGRRLRLADHATRIWRRTTTRPSASSASPARPKDCAARRTASFRRRRRSSRTSISCYRACEKLGHQGDELAAGGDHERR